MGLANLIEQHKLRKDTVSGFLRWLVSDKMMSRTNHFFVEMEGWEISDTEFISSRLGRTMNGTEGGWNNRMDGLIRKKDLVETVGVAKSTIADWVVEFHVFIPTVKHGAVTYYRPEAIDVLNYIKELRSRDYAKPQIIERLTKEGYPITVEEAVEDVQRVLSRANARDTLLNVMQTLGITMGEIGKQAEHLTKQDKKLDTHENWIEEQKSKVDELEKVVEELKQQLAVVAKQQKKKSLWRRLINH